MSKELEKLVEIQAAQDNAIYQFGIVLANLTLQVAAIDRRLHNMQQAMWQLTGPDVWEGGSRRTAQLPDRDDDPVPADGE